jgi:hypothetical protein
MAYLWAFSKILFSKSWDVVEGLGDKRYTRLVYGTALANAEQDFQDVGPPDVHSLQT